VLLSYVWRELLRNPRRTLAALAGVTLGVGLFSAVLFFVDGSGASMTSRAIAPLALDMQRVLTSPLGGGLGLREGLFPSGPLRAGQTARITLRVTNNGAVPANEVVVADESPPPLTYLSGTMTLNGRALRDRGGQSPLAQGLARTGLNIGTVSPRTTVTITYLVRARRAVGAASALPLHGTISSREHVVPAPANAPAQLNLEQLRAKVARIPGVAAADGLAFVDLPPGSLRTVSSTVRSPIRVFAFDRRYQEHYPSIRAPSGGFRPGSALLSAEASRALAAKPGATVELRLPGRGRRLSLPVSGVADLSRAKPLFYSRKSTKLEDFLYVANTLIVSPETFRQAIIPAFRAASAARGRLVRDLPLLELDVLVDRSRLHSDPASALLQTKAIARAVRRVAPGQDYLIDNVSNTLEVAKDDAAVAKRMFLFLGLPGALLAAFLAAYAGGVLASAQRRERANLRIRGAHRGHLLRMLAYRTGALAGAGSVIGTGLGLLSVMVILGRGPLFEASAEALAASALVAVTVGMLTTGLALYIPGRRSLSREISQERGELAPTRRPAWQRLGLDFIMLAAVAIGEWAALRAGAFDAPAGSVYEGRAVSLPSHLLLAPLLAWVAGMLLSVRVFQGIASRLPAPAPPRFGPPVRGTLARSLRMRSWALAGGVVAVGLVVAFGTALAIFASSYDAGKAADSRFVVGSDIRVTPSVFSLRPHPPSFASRLEVSGVSAATPVVFKLENSVVNGPYNQERADLAAIEPRSFRRVAALGDALFVEGSAAEAIAALRADPRGLLVNSKMADDVQVDKGDRVAVLLARGTSKQTLVRVRVVGLFEKLPGFPEGVDLVANVGYYAAATRSRHADFFLARSAGRGHQGLAQAVAALRSGPGRRDRINIETRQTALGKDQSSLTALNVHGLLDVNSLYTLLMAAAAIAIFVFGLMLQRRREYVALRAQGMQTRETQALVLGEAAPVAGFGLAAGMLVGTGMAALFVHVLRPLFVLDPGLRVSLAEIASLVGLTAAATIASALTATAMLARLRPTELLRE
jgi:putative ABC transport system permease protein